ncbi:MAG: RNA-splicing ligase RtcB, partial [Hyphomicrobiaceae bacterium]|nr:RNA-splicing ligase RtcB [Hyphomicrobiaceae bacterium]
MITGKTLIAWGYAPGPWFASAIPAAEKARASGADEAAIRALVDGFAPARPPKPVPLRAAGGVAYTLNIRAEEPEDADNIAGVERHMAELMRTPTLVAGAVMPDACPSGSARGTIPVGGVVAAKDAIHPGMHSSDICCSMALSVLGDVDPTALLDAGMKLSHFGGGGRPHSQDMQPPDALMAELVDNRFLARTSEAAKQHFGTQGDGNHFFFVGRLASTGQVALVTHHGSRKPGALLYKAGMDLAESYR